MPSMMGACSHPLQMNRRAAVQAGAVGLLGLGMNHLSGLREAAGGATPRARTCIYIFLSGGLSQHDSFDPKPEAPAEIRGEFAPIATNSPGLMICEHLPLLAQRSRLWSVCRSLTHPTNDHTAGHHMMLTGRTALPVGFRADGPSPNDHPSIASICGALTPPRNNLPPAAVIPERLVHYSGRVIPGQFGGQMGSQHDAWFVEASPFHNTSYGAFPQYQFDHQERGGPITAVSGAKSGAAARTDRRQAGAASGTADRAGGAAALPGRERTN
jgi:hypothetical protein